MQKVDCREAVSHQVAVRYRPSDGLFVNREVERAVTAGSLGLVHTVGNVLRLLHPRRDARLELIEACKEGFKLLSVFLPRRELLLIIRPALVGGGACFVEPAESGSNLGLHLLGAWVAGVDVHRLWVKFIQQVVPDNARDNAGHGDLRAVVADAGVPHLGRHVDKVAHNVLKTGGGGAFVRQTH